MSNEAYMSTTQLARAFPNSHRADEIHTLAVRGRRPIPHIECGRKRPVVRIRPSVYKLFLQYEEGLITYEQVVQGARRTAEGVR